MTIFRRLQRPDMAACDLRLLSLQAPSLPDLLRFGRDPQRYADDILFALLDVATEELILDNRDMEEETEKVKTEKKQVSGQEPETDADAGTRTAVESPIPAESKKKS